MLYVAKIIGTQESCRKALYYLNRDLFVKKTELQPNYSYSIKALWTPTWYLKSFRIRPRNDLMKFYLYKIKCWITMQGWCRRHIRKVFSRLKNVAYNLSLQDAADLITHVLSRRRQAMELGTRRRARWGSVDVLTINPSAGEEQRWRARFGQEDGASRRTPLLSWPWIGSRLQRTERRQTASTAAAGLLLSSARSKTRGSAGLRQAGGDGNGDGERRRRTI